MRIAVCLPALHPPRPCTHFHVSASGTCRFSFIPHHIKLKGHVLLANLKMYLLTMRLLLLGEVCATPSFSQTAAPGTALVIVVLLSDLLQPLSAPLQPPSETPQPPSGTLQPSSAALPQDACNSVQSCPHQSPSCNGNTTNPSPFANLHSPLR